jgi:hypothetical protein
MAGPEVGVPASSSPGFRLLFQQISRVNWLEDRAQMASRQSVEQLIDVLTEDRRHVNDRSLETGI